MDVKNIQWRGKISIQQVLAEIRADQTKPFWLAFVRATGNECGSIKVVSKALYGAPRRTGTGAALATKDDRKRSMHVDRGTLPMSDYDTPNQYLTPLISHIIGYNLYQVTH